MKKRIIFLSLMVLSLSMVGCSKKGSSELTGTYNIHVGGYDWGAGVSKAIVSLDYPLDNLSKDDFSITETKQVTDFTKAPEFPVEIVTVPREITNAYLCDENGNKVDGESKYIAFEMYVSPNDGSPLLFSMSTQINTWSDPYYLTIQLNDNAKLTSGGMEVTSLKIDTEVKNKTTDADMLKTDSFKASDGTTYNYGTYSPQEETDTLVVWLHGLGEGGTDKTDPLVTSLANKVTALMSDEFQKTVGNAHVLVPQCPTYWMDNDGKGSNLNNGGIQADGTSFYTQSLTELIDFYQEKCGAKKIVLAGCSNGGYMTLVLAIDNPDKYAAIVPICEALSDDLITDQQIKDLAKIPSFYIYSEDDTTVVPAKHEVPTLKRLESQNPVNLCVSTSKQVVDTSGHYKGEDGKAYVYNGHWSWIYFDNNESKCDKTGQVVWDWIANQVK